MLGVRVLHFDFGKFRSLRASIQLLDYLIIPIFLFTLPFILKCAHILRLLE